MGQLLIHRGNAGSVKGRSATTAAQLCAVAAHNGLTPISPLSAPFFIRHGLPRVSWRKKKTREERLALAFVNTACDKLRPVETSPATDIQRFFGALKRTVG